MLLGFFYVEGHCHGQFSKAEYCAMVLWYGEWGRKARLAARLYLEGIPTGLHFSYQIILSVIKRLRKTGCVTSRGRSGRPAEVGRQFQPYEVLPYALAYPKCSTRYISEHCGLSKGQVWKDLTRKDLQESGGYPNRLTLKHVLKTEMPIDVNHGALRQEWDAGPAYILGKWCVDGWGIIFTEWRVQ